MLSPPPYSLSTGKKTALHTRAPPASALRVCRRRLAMALLRYQRSPPPCSPPPMPPPMPPPHRRRTARRASCAQGSRYGVCVRERRRGPGRGLWPGLARARLPTSSAASARHARAQRAQACRAPPPATRGEWPRCALRVDCERRGNARRLHGGRDAIAHARATGLASERESARRAGRAPWLRRGGWCSSLARAGW